MSKDLCGTGATWEPFPRHVLAAPAPRVAPDLLGAVLQVDGRAGRIVEVEAYGGDDDPASHASRGRSTRNSSMFARAGTLYCYRSYGIHTCANVVTGVEGEGQAVLVRALEPLCGLGAMNAARGGVRRAEDLVNGPGKLCQAMGIDLAHDGVDLCDPAAPVVLWHDPAATPMPLCRGPRTGISRAVEREWRFWVTDNGFVSS